MNFFLFNLFNIDEFVRSLKIWFSVIPAKAGIQFFQIVKNSLDSGFHRSDDFFARSSILDFEYSSAVSAISAVNPYFNFFSVS
jgi:hypothetical protein